MNLKAFTILTAALVSTNLFAGGGATGISAYSRFNKIACVNANGTIEDALKISPIEPSHLVLDLMDRSVSIGGYVGESEANDRCWVELWGHLTRKLAIESVSGKNLWGTETEACEIAKAQFTQVVPTHAKVLWLDNDNVALPSDLPAAEYCSNANAKVHVLFKFD